jgi:putative Mg2+ transporter-C (MgtC) family protein
MIMTTWQEALIWIGKLCLSAILGAAIGFERESHGQAAGLRTYIMVSTGSCLMMMLSLHMAELFNSLDANSPIRLDPGRIASYAVAGMGFLGGGAIIKGKGSVRGLTTAAGLWLVTGVGLSNGAGYIFPAIFTTILSLLILYNLRHLKTLVSHDVFTILNLTCYGSEPALRLIKKVLAEYSKIEISFVNYSCDIEAKTTKYSLRLCSKGDMAWGQIVRKLMSQVPGLKEIAWEEGDVP